jgi:exopolyphosphatase/guanosine-5'-triphosphate,3'-diphosphate pyrophosphatase
METLKIDTLHYSTAGVRDGIIADLASKGIGREAMRLSTQQMNVVEAMCRKYAVDLANARHVASFAAELFDATQPLHRLPAEFGKLLHTAGWLHDTGHFISDTGHHKHSAYIVSSSDMPGYTERERLLVALLCRYHRKTLPQSRHESYRNLNPDERRAISLLTPLLRMAVALDTAKQQRVQSMECRVEGTSAAVRIAGQGDIDLEVWAAERAADTFRQMYNVPMNVERV